jgi:hypothetical protein
LTAKNEDKSWKEDNAANVLIGRVAEQVVQHYAGATKAKKD